MKISKRKKMKLRKTYRKEQDRRKNWKVNGKFFLKKRRLVM